MPETKPKATATITERANGSVIVEITLPNGALFRFNADHQNSISVTSVDGKLIIYPKATNYIEITTDLV